MKKGYYYFLLIFFFAMFLFSGYKIISYLKNNHENKKIKDSINEKIQIVKTDSSDDKRHYTYQIDFSALKKDNPDTVGYLEVNGTSINYVVVKGKDNDYYLRHNYHKDANVGGWVFVDYRNQLDESDKNIIIYGHSMRDGSMFGTLKNVFDEKWRNNEENLKIVFVTEMGTYYYQVFSTYDIDPEEYYIQTTFKSDEEYLKFLYQLRDRSRYSYSIDLSVTDKILTLSTCNWSGSKRVVLHAKRIDTEGGMIDE